MSHMIENASLLEDADIITDSSKSRLSKNETHSKSKAPEQELLLGVVRMMESNRWMRVKEKLHLRSGT